MSNPFQFGSTQVAAGSRYAAMGFKRNPFEPSDEDDHEGPFYAGHLESQIEEISRWVSECFERPTEALSLKGTIGAGKTRVLKALRQRLLQDRVNRRLFVEHVFLNRAGYTRPNVAGFLLDAIESSEPEWSLAEVDTVPAGVMPYIWAVAKSKVNVQPDRRMSLIVSRLQKSPDQARDAEVLTRWLRRDSISATQGRNLGINGKIDAEGEQVQVLCDLLRAGSAVGVLKKLFLFIDQLEDLMRPSYSELRKSRILEDLRSLMDYIDGGAPIGLVLSWSPEIDYGRYERGGPDVDGTLESRYPAFYSRARRRIVQLEILRLSDAVNFAEQYAAAALAKDKTLADVSKLVSDIALAAWTAVKNEGLASGDRVAPRDFLAGLEAEVESRT